MITFNMDDVALHLGGLGNADIRKAVGELGEDHTPLQPTFMGTGNRELGPAGNRPKWPGIPKYEIQTEIAKTSDDDWVGRIVWNLLGYTGSFPVVTDYVGEVPMSAHPTYFPNARLCRDTCIECEAQLRKQFAAFWSEASP
jgi:hypothetical protein